MDEHDTDINPVELFNAKYGFSLIKYADLVKFELNEEDEAGTVKSPVLPPAAVAASEADYEIYLPRLKNVLPDPIKKVDHMIENCEVYFMFKLTAYSYDAIWQHGVIAHMDNLTPVDIPSNPDLKAKMTPESFPSKWTLFPFNQGHELIDSVVFRLLGIPGDQIVDEFDEFEYDPETGDSSIQIAENIVFCIGSDPEGHVMYTYSTSEDNYTSFVEPRAWMQEGDGRTIVYLLQNGNLVICNEGDVSSAAYLQIAF